MINAGNIENKGVEVAFNATPYISESGFQWDTQLNWSKNINKVISLTDDTKEQILSDASVSFLKIVAHEGGAYGDITVTLINGMITATLLSVPMVFL